MVILSAKIREKEEKNSNLKEKGQIAGVLYGRKIENKNLKLNYKEFENAYKESGLSTLVTLKIEGKEVPVLIHDLQKDPLTGSFSHVDFYQPNLHEKIGAKVPLVFEGISKAVKDLEGTLVKHMQEIEVKAIPEKLPREIKVSVEGLETFEDTIVVKDLDIPEGVEVSRDPEEIIVSVSAPEKVEEELEKPIEEKEEKEEKEEEKEGEKAEEGKEEPEGKEQTEGEKKEEKK